MTVFELTYRQTLFPDGSYWYKVLTEALNLEAERRVRTLAEGA